MSTQSKKKETVQAGGRKKPAARAVGALVPRITRAAFETHGFPAAGLLTDWPQIVGAEFADITAPERLKWPRDAQPLDPENSPPQTPASRRRRGAILVVRVEGPRVLELQYDAAHVIDRINSYFGYRAVAELRFVQGPVRRDRGPALPPAAAHPDTHAVKADIEDERLRAALARLAATTS